MAPSQTEVKRSSFPEDFIFGGATSAYQVEGAWNVGGKGWNNWDHMTLHYPESIKDNSNGCEAIDHFNMFKQDVALMKEIGLNSYRFSFSWSRILPGGRLCDGISKEGIQFYNNLIDTLLKEGIEPCATLFHWDVPQVLENEYGGFLNHKIVKHFCEFAQICFWEFGDRVKYWVTLNEPWSFTVCGYALERFPPRRGCPLDKVERTPETLEQQYCNSILQHRSNITVSPLTSSEGVSMRELAEISYKLAYDTSPEGDEVRKLVAQVNNLPYITSSEDGTSSEGYYQVGEVSKGDSVREEGVSKANNSPEGDSVREEGVSKANTSSKGDRVRVCSVPPNLRQLPSKGDSVKLSSKTQSPHFFSSKGHPGIEPYKVAHNLILAHAHAVNIYRKYYQEHQQGKIGMTNVSMWYYPFDKDNPEDVKAASRALDFLLGWFVDPVITGEYPKSMRENVGKRLPEFTPDEVAVVKGSCDFLGINYYTARYAQNVPRETSITHYHNDLHTKAETHRGNNQPIGPRGGSNWLYVVPDGIYNIMLHIKERYNNPEIIITENGMDEVKNDALTISQATIDETRVTYYKDHLAHLRKAMEDGVRLKGYYIWSFFDNFEWDSGYNVRFGVYYVDFKNDLERYPKRSAQWWKDFLNKSKDSMATGCQNFRKTTQFCEKAKMKQCLN